MSRIKTTNHYQQIGVGFDSQWIHIGAGNTGRTTIVPQSANPNTPGDNPGPGSDIVVLIKVVINTPGASSPTILTDSAVGMIASIEAAAGTGQMPYNLPLKGSLYIDNTGGADLTVVFRNH